MTILDDARSWNDGLTILVRQQLNRRFSAVKCRLVSIESVAVRRSISLHQGRKTGPAVFVGLQYWQAGENVVAGEQ